MLYEVITALIDLEEGIVLTEDKVVPPPHEPGLLPKWLAEKGATDIIAGGMGVITSYSIHYTKLYETNHP